MSPEIELSLDDAVEEVLAMLTGLDLQYDPRYDRYRLITRMLNRALRSNALEKEWSYYSDIITIPAVPGDREYTISADETQRFRGINDDAVRVVSTDGEPIIWAYYLPRDALHKYAWRSGWWASVTRNTLTLSKPLTEATEGYNLELPVMREPTMFRLPAQPEDPNVPIDEPLQDVRDQIVDFAYPDVIVMRAAFYYAQTDPVMQPRVQNLEAMYKDLMYQAIERDDRNTDSPFNNEFLVPVQGTVFPETAVRPWPVSDRRL